MKDDNIEYFFYRAAKAGIVIDAICARANIDKSSPSRWRRTGIYSPDHMAIANQALDELIDEKINGLRGGQFVRADVLDQLKTKGE